MAISTELKKIYSDYDDTRRFYDTVQLYHPTFNADAVTWFPSDTRYPGATYYPQDIDPNFQSFFLVRDSQDHTFLLDDGVTEQVFSAYPFNVIQPQAGEDQQDIGIVLDNVSREILSNIELAATNQEVPIIMTFRVYAEGETGSQITPISLALTEVVVDMFTVSCKASRTDLFSRRLPNGKNTYFNENFKGLIV